MLAITVEYTHKHTRDICDTYLVYNIYGGATQLYVRDSVFFYGMHNWSCKAIRNIYLDDNEQFY